MSFLSKQAWLDVAEIVDAWRVFPRLYLALFWYFLWDVHQWYTAAAATSDVYANLVFGSISALTGFYMGSGRKWGG